jgi:tetratricopeptide (TPR) repeat protein
MLNPYVLRDLDRTYIMAFLTAWWEQELQRQGYRPGDISRQAIRFEIERDLQTESSAGTRAWLAASERRFAEALEYYRKAIERSKDGAVRLHARRGHVFYLIGNDDSARVEMESALAGLRKEESSEFVYLYDSKAVLEHSIGMIHERRGNLAAAREAYGRALQEDLSYYPAHARLGLLALEARDTTTALSEFALAIELRGNEPSLRYVYGQVLAAVSKFDEANEQLRKTVELEPLYAAPYYLLGRLAEAAKQSGEASTQYQAFVVRAHSRDANLPDARARLSALTDLAGNP